MKRLNKKGFTLVELLAVITIMGILMLVAIPAISRTIENTRRDTFMDTAKSYINAAKNSVASDEFCNPHTKQPLSAMGTAYYYYFFNPNDSTGQDLMEQGGKSSWGNANVKGYVIIHKTFDESTKKPKYEYSVIMVDSQGRGIGEANSNGEPTKVYSEKSLRRSAVSSTNGNNRKKFYDVNPAPLPGITSIDDTLIPSGATIDPLSFYC